MKIMDILKKCKYDNIEKKIKLHYGEKELKEYKNLYEVLINKISNTTSDSIMYIYITVYFKSDDNSTPIESFSEDDETLDFDVSAYELDDDTVYSIAASSYSDFLQYNIDPKTLTKFSYESIMAHCFYEITAYGFEDNI